MQLWGVWTPSHQSWIAAADIVLDCVSTVCSNVMYAITGIIGVYVNVTTPCSLKQMIVAKLDISFFLVIETTWFFFSLQLHFDIEGVYDGQKKKMYFIVLQLGNQLGILFLVSSIIIIETSSTFSYLAHRHNIWYKNEIKNFECWEIKSFSPRRKRHNKTIPNLISNCIYTAVNWLLIKDFKLEEISMSRFWPTIYILCCAICPLYYMRTQTRSNNKCCNLSKNDSFLVIYTASESFYWIFHSQKSFKSSSIPPTSLFSV